VVGLLMAQGPGRRAQNKTSIKPENLNINITCIEKRLESCNFKQSPVDFRFFIPNLADKK
jgi:hypothetical protein